MGETKRFSLVLGDHLLPVDIHALAVDEQGQVVGASARSFDFRFVYRGIPISARFSYEAETAALIVLEGDLGPMPFSAESPLARAQLQAVLDAANADLGEHFRVVGGRIRLFATVEVENPVTAVGLVTALTLLLLPIKPYLETIGVFVRPPAEADAGDHAALQAGWRRHRVPRKVRAD